MILDQSFQNLTPDERLTLMNGADSLQFEPGGIVIKEGDHLRELLVVSKGMLRVTRKDGEHGLVEFVAPLGPGEIIGELSFMDGKGASATLVSDGAVELLRIQPTVLDGLQSDDPTFFGRFYQDLFLHLARRLRSTNIRVTQP